jgi:hypothetical protein
MLKRRRIFLRFKKVITFLARRWLAVSIPVIAMVYGFADHQAWWDQVFGRTALSHSLARLASPDGFPTVFIYSDQPEFARLEAFISARTANIKIRRRSTAGQRPTLITRGGGGERVIPTPPGWPRFISVPAESPILYFYGAVPPNQLGSDVDWAATLQDVSHWIDRDRNTERMLVTIVLISILSIALVIHESKLESGGMLPTNRSQPTVDNQTMDRPDCAK